MKNAPALALALLPLQDTTPQPAGIDPARLTTLVERVRRGELQNVHGILVLQDGELLLEEYFGGWTAGRQHYTASVSKSVTSLLLGRAMELGILEGMDDGVLDLPIAELFPGYRELILEDEGKRELLFRHVLSMTAGLDWDESTHPYGDPRNDCHRAENAQDPVAFVLSRPVVEEPGTSFEYNGGLSILLSHLLAQRSGVTTSRFAEEVLFGPLGIEEFTWEELPSGLTDTGGGLHLRPRDQLKIGLLALDAGRWNGQQIVPPGWLRESTRRHVGSDDGPDYGLQWWCGELFVGDTEIHTFFASGHGGQKIFIVPALEAVVVIAQQVFDNPMDELNNLVIMTSHVLPALLPPAPPAEAFVLEEPGRYVGKYTSDPAGDEVSVELADGKLIAIGGDGSRMELLPKGRNRFTCVLMGVLEVPMRFREDDDGGMVGLVTRLGFRERAFRRRR